jgi:hypothetical protein
MDKKNSGGNHWHVGSEAISYLGRFFKKFCALKNKFYELNLG